MGLMKRVISRGSSQPNRTYSSTSASAIASRVPASPGSTMPTNSKGSWGESCLAILSSGGGDRAARQIAEHEAVLVARGQAGAGRFPGPFSAQPTVLGLGDLDQRLLGDGVQRVVVGLTAEHELHADFLLVE